MTKLVIGFVFLIVAQTGFWHETNRMYPDMSIVPEVPGTAAIKALSFGDEQALFRYYALTIQNAGDTFGRFTSLKQYDYKKLYHWFSLLDVMDNRSDFVPAMASYYFSNTPNVEDLRYIVDYLLEHSEGRISEKWWWVTQAIYMTNHRLKDVDEAARIAHMLEGHHDIPLWAQQMPAFIYEQVGEFEMAAKIIDSIMVEVESISPHELRFMEFFVQERLSALEEEVKKRTGVQQKAPAQEMD